ncbi:MAG: Gfo/Idh/MocA family oxidoreductase [Planctomycetota bacterium]|nr:Gfo/Idh/MocA family oxidoreductase [Planctomycetota bacterium]
MYRSSRREFLEQSMLAAAASAVAASPLRSASAEDKTSGGTDSPNEVLRVAQLGVNGQGSGHLGQWIGRQGCEVVAIVDPDEGVGQTKGVDRVEKATGKKPAFYQDLREAFEKTEIDVVSIATPNHWHALAAIWAIQAGKDVYVEKPVSHNVSEGRRIVQAARKHQKMVQTGTQCRSMQGTIDAINFVKAGKIGEVKLARGLCYKNRPSIGARGTYDVPPGIDYNIWLGPAPEVTLSRPRFHYDWHWQWDYGNGDLGNQGIHQMDIARWGLGVDDLGTEAVAYGGRVGYEDAGETANTQVSIHTYGDKRLVFEVRGLKSDGEKGARVGVIFYGTDGYVVLSSYNGGAAFDLDGNMIQSFNGEGDHFGNFAQAVRSRNVDELNADILQGHLSSALCHLGNVSYRLGSPSTLAETAARLEGDAEALETLERVKTHLADNMLDPNTTPTTYGATLAIDSTDELITGEFAEAANPHMTREYRAPFVVPKAEEV